MLHICYLKQMIRWLPCENVIVVGTSLLPLEITVHYVIVFVTTLFYNYVNF